MAAAEEEKKSAVALPKIKDFIKEVDNSAYKSEDFGISDALLAKSGTAFG